MKELLFFSIPTIFWKFSIVEKLFSNLEYRLTSENIKIEEVLTH